MPDSSKAAGSLWSRLRPFAFAFLASLLAVGLELAVGKITSEPIFPSLPGVAAIMACAIWGGPESGFASTVLMTIWAMIDVKYFYGLSTANTMIRCLLFASEGILISVGVAHLRRAVRDSVRSEEWHRKLVETAAEGIWVLDKRGAIVWANARMAGMLGVPEDGLAGRSADEFFFPGDLSMERIRRESLRAGQTEQFDRRLRRGDGSELWVLVCCNLTTLETGDVSGSLAMMTDITERKRAEQALRRSEERFRNLFENVLEGVFQSTADGRILAANPMLLQMLGLSSVSDLDNANDFYVDRDVRKRLLERLEREGNFQNVELELRRRDGRIITVLANSRVVRDEAGQMLYHEGTVTDITHKKRIEEQLRQAQKVEALGRLAGGIAHDFSNVLTVIAGYAELALENLGPTHPARAQIEQVMQSVESAVALTRQLTSFSRRQAAGQGGLDLNRAIENCESALQRSLPGGSPHGAVRLMVSYAREVLPVYADQEQIDQVVLTLSGSLREAVPAMRTLGIKLELIQLEAEWCRRYPAARPGPCALLSICNADSEMRPTPELLADPLFKPAQPLDATTLGLSAIHALIAQGEGFMSITAASGAPSAFHVVLPCAVLPVTGQTAELSGFPAAAPASETILLVEVEPLVRELSRDMLERQGYRVILAGDAHEAERIGDHAASFDLLITDTVMPTISGVELARRLRASHPGLKVLFIQGYADKQVEHDDLTALEASFLQKPFSADSLGRKIRQVLNRS